MVSASMFYVIIQTVVVPNVVMMNAMMITIVMLRHNAEFYCAECHDDKYSAECRDDTAAVGATEICY